MKLRVELCITIAALFTALSWWYWQPAHNGVLTLAMLNIGQGDAIYIRTPQGSDILIDGGPNRSILYELGKSMPPSDRIIELVIATHPDSDHIAGLMEVTDRYTITHLITNGRAKETQVAQQFAEWIETYRIPNTVAQRGDRLDIEPGVWLEFLHPSEESHTDTNDDSIVAILHDRDVKIMLTGDAPQTIEEELIATYSAKELDVELLKVGHHGSRFSTSQEWLQATTPAIALISAGANNSYHHPHPSLLYRLRASGVDIYRTDQHERITCRSDGVAVSCIPE